MDIKEALKSGLIGGIIGGAISFVLNLTVFPVPINVNAKWYW